jgi:copper(I)-binding protein
MMRAILFCLSLAVAGVAQAGVEVKDPWVRGTVPGQTTTGAFMTLRASEKLTVVGVETTAAHRAEIHSSEMKDGVMRMRPVPRLTLPANKDVKLQGDLHLMLIDVTHTLRAGDEVPIKLIVEDARGRRSPVEVKAPVRPLGS